MSYRGSRSACAGVGVLLLVGAVSGGLVLGREARLLWRLRTRGRRTVGTVVGQSVQGGRPVVRFVDVRGRSVEFASWRTVRWRVPPGQQFFLVYLPEQPHRARLAGEARQRTLAGFAAADLLALGLGVALLS